MTTENEFAQFAALRQLKKSACVLLALNILGRPAGAREIAAILDLNEHTVSKYLRELSSMNLVFRLSYHQGYILVGFPQMLLGEDLNVKNSHFLPTTINTIGRKREIEEVIVVDSAPNVKNQHLSGRNARNPHWPTVREKRNINGFQANPLPPPDPAVVQALQQAGIGEPKRSRIASLPHVTPDYVRLWESYLIAVRGEKYTPGLLIHVLQNGDPAPPANEYGHFKGCRCASCDPYAVYTCPDCFAYPCECDAGEEEEEYDDDEGE